LVDIRKYPEQGIFWKKGIPYLSKMKIPCIIYCCFEGFNWNWGDKVVAGLGGRENHGLLSDLGNVR
jgi:hypothetical protein